MGYLAAIAVDRRQNFIFAADKLREMAGASQLIESSQDSIQKNLKPGVDVVRCVSGEAWLRSDNLDLLATTLWSIRQELVENDANRLSVTFAIHPYEGNLDLKFADEVAALERELRKRKDNPAGIDGTAASPFFARCRVQPEQAANLWRKEAERRRRLVSTGTQARVAAWGGFQARLLAAVPELDTKMIAEQLAHFVEGEPDSYLALLKADVDGLGSLQQSGIDWKRAGETHPQGAAGFAKEFSRQVQNSLGEAVNSSMRDAWAQAGTDAPSYFPFVPLVSAGDDLWVLANRRYALDFAVNVSERFAAAMNSNRQGCFATCIREDHRFSLSFGVVFAKQGYPIDQMLEIAEDLLKNAKRARRERKSNEGFLDYHWLASSARERVHQARAALCLEGDSTRQLYTRPWTIGEARKMFAASRLLEVLPTGKLRLLDAILRKEDAPMKVSCHQWWVRLRPFERNSFDTALAELPERVRVRSATLCATNGALPQGPFIEEDNGTLLTPLLELVELREILGTKGATNGTGNG